MITAINRIPTWAKVAYRSFVAILVPCYWVSYSPWNFLYFCDIALLITGVAIWIESPLLISMQAIAITAPQMLWVIDFLCRLIAGVNVTGVTSYMFDSSIPLFLRVLSLFHGWLPFLLLWLLSRLGYDRRALGLQSAVAVMVLLISYLFAPAPPPSVSHHNWAVNINYVFGFDDKRPQTLMAPWLWLLSMMALNVIAFYLPTHFVLRRAFAAPCASSRHSAKKNPLSKRGRGRRRSRKAGVGANAKSVGSTTPARTIFKSI